MSARTTSVYDACKAMLIDDPAAASQDEMYANMLECIGTSNANSIDTFFLIYSSSLVFFMQAGKLFKSCFVMLTLYVMATNGSLFISYILHHIIL